MQAPSPMYIGARNCEAMLGLRWRHVNELMRDADVEPLRVGSKRLYRIVEIIEVLEGEIERERQMELTDEQERDAVLAQLGLQRVVR